MVNEDRCWFFVDLTEPFMPGYNLAWSELINRARDSWLNSTTIETMFSYAETNQFSVHKIPRSLSLWTSSTQYTHIFFVWITVQCHKMWRITLERHPAGSNEENMHNARTILLNIAENWVKWGKIISEDDMLRLGDPFSGTLEWLLSSCSYRFNQNW